MTELDIPLFLKRGTKEHKALIKKAEKNGGGMALVERTDPDAPLHALAAELGLRRHQYRVDWLRDPRWVERYRKLHAEKIADREAKNEKKKLNAVPKAPKPKKVKSASAKLALVPPGRIVVVNDKNPKKEGTDAWERWNLLLTKYHGRTTEAYVLDGRNPKTLENAIKQKRVRVVEDGQDDTERAPASAVQPDEQPEGRARAGAAGKSRAKSASAGKANVKRRK